MAHGAGAVIARCFAIEPLIPTALVSDLRRQILLWGRRSGPFQLAKRGKWVEDQAATIQDLKSLVEPVNRDAYEFRKATSIHVKGSC